MAIPYSLILCQVRPGKPEQGNKTYPKAQYAQLLNDLIECDVLYLGEIGLNRIERVDMLHALTDYYALHLDSIRKVQSISILQQLF